ncbi:MAG: hypothetical protein Q7K35_03480, partial [bacterium]|nr:hypothetical protein [bacterium]
MDLKHFKIFFLFVLAIFLTIGLTISFQSLLAAWTAPSANPPNNNTDAPLNAGNTVQSKQGSLWINTAGAFDPGLWVTGNVGIGVSNPSAKLEVVGTTKITGTFGNEMLEPNLFAPTFQQNLNGQSVTALKIAPVYNQGSSSGINNTDLLINRTEIGFQTPGKQFLIDAQVGGVSKFVVDNKGKIGIGTDAPVARLAVSDSVAPFSPPNPNTESELDVGGFHFGDTVQYRYYSYKDIGGARIYSSTVTGGILTIEELGGGPGSHVFLNWENSPDLVDGYRILRDFTLAGENDDGLFDEYADTTGNSFTDSNQGQFQSGSNVASSLVTLANYNTGTDFFGLYTNSKAFFDNNVGIGT